MGDAGPFPAGGAPLTVPVNGAADLFVALRCRQAGNPMLAEQICRRVLADNPEFADAMRFLAALSLDVGQVGGALHFAARALQISPESADGHQDLAVISNNVGNAFRDRGMPDPAGNFFRAALALSPHTPEILSNFGLLLKQRSDVAAAARYYHRALRLANDVAAAYGNLGNALMDLGQLVDAEKASRCALVLDPGYSVGHYNLGNVLLRGGKSYQAIQSFINSLVVDASSAEVRCNLASALKSNHRYAEALHNAHGAVRMSPFLGEARQTLASMLGHLSDFEGVTAESDVAMSLQVRDDDLLWESRLYLYSYHPDLGADEIFAEFARWGARYPDPPAGSFGVRDQSPGRRLKVGYVSPDFRRHTSRFYFYPLFGNHDRSEVELFAYSNVINPDDETARFRGMFDQWRDICGMPDEAAAALIRDDGIDILVDVCNHMINTRLHLFALKPAPIQVTWLGSAWTTGLKAVDYVLLDGHVAPEGTLASEAIVRLPGSFMIFRPPPSPEVGPLPLERNGFVTFGYSGRTERLNHHVFAAWSEILASLPEARLVLDFPPFADPPTQDYYRALLTSFGIDPGRVILRKSENIFEGLKDIDILLDCFPHSGGTMLLDALWMGVPAVTLASRPPVGRIGTGLMMNLGLPEWVASNTKDYIAKAVRFAKDKDRLIELRGGMRERMSASPLMNERGFVRGVETAYRTMWRRWCAGEPATQIIVEDAAV